MLRIGWFSTGNGKAARDLLKVALNIPEVKIEFVFCNRKYGESKETDLFLDLVRSRKLPIISWSSRGFKAEQREQYDRIATNFWAPVYGVDLCMLAGYMIICSPWMCKNFNIINLHPAKPGGPKGTWQEVIRQLIKNKERESGVMIHLVTPELDSGPVITYCKYRIKKYDFGKIRQQGLKREFHLITETLRFLAEGKIKIEVLPTGGHDLTKIINRKINPIIKLLS